MESCRGCPKPLPPSAARTTPVSRRVRPELPRHGPVEHSTSRVRRRRGVRGDSQAVGKADRVRSQRRTRHLARTRASTSRSLGGACCQIGRQFCGFSRRRRSARFEAAEPVRSILTRPPSAGFSSAAGRSEPARVRAGRVQARDRGLAARPRRVRECPRAPGFAQASATSALRRRRPSASALQRFFDQASRTQRAQQTRGLIGGRRLSKASSAMSSMMRRSNESVRHVQRELAGDQGVPLLAQLERHDDRASRK